MTTPAKIIPTKMKHLTLLEQHLVCLFAVADVTLLVVIVFVVVTCACSGADGVAAAGVDVIC